MHFVQKQDLQFVSIWKIWWLTKSIKSGKIIKSPQDGVYITKPTKKSQKTFKKGIDKREWLWYNNKAVRKTGKRNGHWKLNNEERSTSIKYVQERNSKISERTNTTQTKVREAKIALEMIWTRRGEIKYKHSRVWSWLRMNAGGVHNTFKSNGALRINPSGSVFEA